ncbi:MULTISPECIES: NlpC/P60 family protein [unclassified Kitasatospora]|uniref:C40 family peptidase n=1 Tax=unclassified Kitasatospora TaxID=2633591 RepID=UPI003830317A
MGQHRLPKTRNRQRISALTLTAGGALLLSGTVAHAAPSTPAPGAKPSLEQVQREVDALYEEVEVATEQQNGLQERQQQLEAQAGTFQQQLADQQAKINTVHESLATVAGEQYRTGGIDPTVKLMLSSSPEDYLGRAGLQEAATADQSATLVRLQADQRKIDQLRTETAARLAELDGNRAQLAAKKTEVQAKLAKVQGILNGLKADERAKVLRENQQAAAAAQQAASRGTNRSDAPGSNGEGASGTPQSAPPAPSAGRAKDILAFGYAQLGKPYVRGGVGPSGFDCSGLTVTAYAAANIKIPRTSQDQYRIGTKISRDQLQPGDLVFYYPDIHHVGIYAGDGKLLHAPRTGKNVEVVPLDSMPYAGAVRV